MKMAAAAGDCDDVQVLTTESIAQDFGDGNDYSCYFCESLIFLVFCGCSRVQNLKAPKGRPWTASKAFKLHICHGTLWAHLISSSTRSEGGCVWKYEHVRWPPCRFSAQGDASSAKGGVAVHRGDAKWSCPD